jgi:hypothetical protein
MACERPATEHYAVSGGTVPPSMMIIRAVYGKHGVFDTNLAGEDIGRRPRLPRAATPHHTRRHVHRFISARKASRMPFIRPVLAGAPAEAGALALSGRFPAYAAEAGATAARGARLHTGRRGRCRGGRMLGRGKPTECVTRR